MQTAMFRASFREKDCKGLRELYSKVEAAHGELGAQYQKFASKKAKVTKLLESLEKTIEENQGEVTPGLMQVAKDDDAIYESVTFMMGDLDLTDENMDEVTVEFFTESLKALKSKLHERKNVL